MHQRLAHQCNGYHKTRRSAQRHNRWLLAIGLVLLAVGANRARQ